MIYTNLPYIQIPNTTNPGGAVPTFRATTSCPDVSLWLLAAAVAGFFLARALK